MSALGLPELMCMMGVGMHNLTEAKCELQCMPLKG